jgi:hypothetical protein
MEPREQSNTQTAPRASLYLKCGVIFLLLLTSFVGVACGQTGPDTTTTTSGPPPATVTIQFNKDLTALPTQPPYVCAAWITNTSPAFVPGSTIPVYAHFIHLVNGNPQGVPNATAQATVLFANGARTALQATTGSDGLAVFSFQLPNDPGIANRNNLVTVTFTAPAASCTVDQSRAAYFTPMLVTPTATATTTPTAVP